LGRRASEFSGFLSTLLVVWLTSGTAPAFAQNSGGAPVQLPPGFSSETGNGGGIAGLAAGASGEAPSAKVAEPVYDFGAVFQGAQIKHTFRVANGGPGALTIGSIGTSCGCTVAQPSKRQVQSGDATEITATFDTSADKGPAQRVITVATNDPKQPRITLTLKGDVKVKVDANPLPVVFDKAPHGVEVSRQVMVSDLISGGDFHITSITNSSPNLKVTQQPRVDGKPGAILTLTLLKTTPAAPFSDIVKVSTNVSPLNIPVYGTVLGDLNVTPAQVSFGIVKHRAGAIRIARLTNASARPVKVIGVSTNNRMISAAVAPVTPGKEFKLTLELLPNSPDGTLRGSVAIQTDDPGQPLVQVPFYGIVGNFSG
jgi:hypothetical protein